MTDHDLVDAMKRCDGELRAGLEELRARGAPDYGTTALESEDSKGALS